MSWINEPPSLEHQKRVERAVEPELALHRIHYRSERFWRWLIALVPLGAAASAIWWIKSPPPSQSTALEFLAFTPVEPLFLELEEFDSLEDFEILDQLEELEEWNS